MKFKKDLKIVIKLSADSQFVKQLEITMLY